jgi:hypothetical protein
MLLVIIPAIGFRGSCFTIFLPTIPCMYILLGPPGCAQVFPYLSPGLLDFFGGMKTANKPHASRNYTQAQLSVHTAAEN